jgi:hypothetical protein
MYYVDVPGMVFAKLKVWLVPRIRLDFPINSDQ